MNTTEPATTPRVGEQRPGGRAARVRADVLQAAAELLTEVGYDNMSVEDVATRAGVHKTTVYRRWPTKAALTADAAALHSADAVPIPDTGTVVGDLKVLAREVVANIRLALSAEVVERAIRRGELPASTDANLLIETIIGPLWVRLLLTGEPITDELADQIVELVTTGATPR